LKVGQLKADGETRISETEAQEFNATIPDFFSEAWERKNGQNVIKAYLIGSVSSSFSLLIASKAYHRYFEIHGRLIPSLPVGLALFAVS